MGHEYKVGDRVRRTASAAVWKIEAGMTGTVVRDGQYQVVVKWDDFPSQCHYDAVDSRIEPIDAAPAAPVTDTQQRSELGMVVTNAGPVHVEPASECVCCAMHVCAAADATQVEQRNRDLLGERDSLKAHVRRLEVALDDAQRKARR